MTTPSIADSLPPSFIDALPPDSLDIIPILSQILSRLQFSSSSSNSLSPPAATPSFNHASTGPLNPKDIPSATDPLKHKIQKARMKARELPDMDRTIDEQMEEIGELEARIKEQRKVLEGLRAIGEKLKLEREGRMET